jgi:hypothetical protein
MYKNFLEKLEKTEKSLKFFESGVEILMSLRAYSAFLFQSILNTRPARLVMKSRGMACLYVRSKSPRNTGGKIRCLHSTRLLGNAGRLVSAGHNRKI